MKDISIVILNWNGKKLLEKFLPPVVKYSPENMADIFVADNGSTDDSIDFLNRKFPQVKIIKLTKNWGFAKGYNLALQKLQSKYFVILNSDVEVTENWLSSPIKILKSDEKIAAVQPKIKSYHNKDFFEYSGAAGGFIDKYGYPFSRGRIIDHIEKDKGQYDNEKSIFWTTGTAMFVKAEIFQKFSGFDEDFFAHMEEIDLCWRLKNAGYKLIYTPQSVVYHVGGGMLPYQHPMKIFLNYRNNLYMMYKNLPKNKLFCTIFSRLFLDALSAFSYLIQFKFSFVFSVFKAHFSFYFALFKLRRKRKIVQNSAVVFQHPEVYKKSIIWSYFIGKKKVFSDLNF